MKTIGQQCYNYLVQKIHNVIQEDFKIIKSFKRQLKQWISINKRHQIKNSIDNNQRNKKQ